MRFLIVLVFLLFSLRNTAAQDYYAIRNTGTLPGEYALDRAYSSDKTILLNQFSNQVLSSPGSIPFNFYFYNQPQLRYRVSENGYLSFNAGDSLPEVPGTVLPDHSIVAFGNDFKLQQLPSPNQGIATQVFSYTVGTAPERKHIIQFFGLTLAEDSLNKPVNNASVYAFAIVLHEGPQGRFDLVYSPYGAPRTKGAIGCKSEGGLSGVLLNDSLNELPLQYSFDKSQFIVYQFRYGLQPEYDLSVQNLQLSRIYPVNSVVNFSGRVSNWGRQTVHAFNLNYSVNGGDTIVHRVNGLSLLPDGHGSYDFYHPVSWTGGSAGSLNQVRFWISAPDTAEDGQAENSLVIRLVLRNLNNLSATRNIILEEGTGAWCGYCPDAHLIVAAAKAQHGNRVIPLAYHQDDAMSNDDASVFLRTYVNSYPDALIDRRVFLGSKATWAGEIASRLNSGSVAEIRISNKSFDPLTRTIRYRVHVRFNDYWYGQLHIGSMITESAVRGIADPNVWSQNNYYSRFRAAGAAGGSGHPLYNELEFMDGYLHQYVHKASPGGVWGQGGIIPSLVSPDSVYHADFSYVLPPAVHVSYSSDNNTGYCSTLDGPGEDEGANIAARIQIVGYLAEYDEDVLKRPILNAVSEPLWNLSAVNAPAATDGSLMLRPNPAQAMLGVYLSDPEAAIDQLVIYNVSGQEMLRFEQISASQDLSFDVSGLPEGLYVCRIQSGGQSVHRQLLICR